MTSAWHTTWSRLFRMSRDELLSRARQRLSNHVDLAMYRVGLTRGHDGWNRARPALRGTFFFSPEDLQQRTHLLRNHLPIEAGKIICEADEICRHHFRLLGYDKLEYGSEIDWHLDAVHGKRAPLKPGFKMPFLDFSIVGDHKVTWELNRHQHLITLAKAWALSRDDKYAAEIVQQWYSWRLANPFPMGMNWSSSLEVAFRSLSWLWVRFLIAGWSEIPISVDPDLLHALALSGGYIERNLSTYFSPNTHLIGEAMTLFFIGTLCPEIPSAERWRSRGWQILQREAELQVRNDGVHFEQSLYYHVYALDCFLHARVLATRNQLEVPGRFDGILDRMLGVLHALSYAGPPDNLGDDDGGRIFDHARNRSEHLTDPLAIGAVLFRRDDLRSAVSLTEEALWLFGEDAIARFAKPPARPDLKTTGFKDSGIYVMANSEPRAQRMVIDAGPFGAGHAGHGHADALSVTLSLEGRRWLIDPGTYNYLSADKERGKFRGTGAHNTLRVDGLDQAVADGPFCWNFLPDVQAEQWITGKTFSLFAGSHTGYLRLADPVLHRRIVFHLHGGFWLVRDIADGHDQHRLDTLWHFAPDLAVCGLQGSFVCSVMQQEAGGTRLAFVPLQDKSWTCELAWDEVSPAYGIKQPAQALRIGAHLQLPAEHATLIVPLQNPSDEAGKLSRLQGSGDNICEYRYVSLGKVHHMIFSGGSASWNSGPWASDAEFLFYSMQDREIVKFILCNGSVASLEGQPIVAHDRKVAQLEWVFQAGTDSVFTSDESAKRSFIPGALRSCNWSTPESVV